MTDTDRPDLHGRPEQHGPADEPGGGVEDHPGKSRRTTRVLHLSITPRGGWHSHAVALVDHLADRPGEHHLLLAWPGALRPARAETIELRCSWIGHRATAGLVTLRQVAAVVRARDVDWVHVHGLPSEPVGFGFAWALCLALRPAGVAVAVTPHNAFGRRGPIEFRGLRQRTLRRFDRVFVFHDEHRTWAGPRAERAPFVHPTDDAAAPARRAASRPDHGYGPMIACLPGQIRADKGFHLVPAALAGHDYAIRIAGPDKGGFAKLESAARRHGIPLIGRPGYADEDEFQAAIATADVVVLPYTRVTQSGVLAYARAAGTPVAASTALRDAGLDVDATFELDDHRSLLHAVEQATGRSRATTGPDPNRDDAHDGVPANQPAHERTISRPDLPTVAPAALYGPPDRLAGLVDELRRGSGVFVVGSPRAGTTVAARWLAGKLGAELPPETHYFTLVGPAAAQSISDDDLSQRLRRSAAYAEATADDLADVVDTWWRDGSAVPLGRYLAKRGTPWVEKTPAHLRHWPELLRFDDRSRILAITRSIPATLVSQTDVPWLAERDPRSLLARILADRLHLGLLRLLAPRRVRVLRYEDLVAQAPALGGGAGSSMTHETWKAGSDRGQVVGDRNRAAQDRNPAIWHIGASPVTMAAAIPGAVARLSLDLARSLSASRGSHQ